MLPLILLDFYYKDTSSYLILAKTISAGFFITLKTLEYVHSYLYSIQISDSIFSSSKILFVRKEYHQLFILIS